MSQNAMSMDVFNQLPSVSEDMLQYILYLPENLSDKASATTVAVVMQGYADSLLPDMQWHRDGFQLKVTPNPDGPGFVLNGTMRIGDCVDDEWCAIWLLREISGKWDVVISAFDSDGEFLLIEAADHLPSWVSPSNAENRVWVYQSRLHLVPLKHVSAPSSNPRRKKYARPRDSDDEDDEFGQPENEDYLNAADGVKLVCDPLTDTLAPLAVEDAVWQRIARYPAAARMHVHHARVSLPKDIAKALVVNPTLVQKAVETFYTRDALQLRAAHRMTRFPPEPSVLTTVKITRTAYAQLVGQKFYPPKVFGKWHEMEGTPEWRCRDVGMKIACGFEMLYQESKNRHVASDLSEGKLTAQSRDEALQRNPDFQKYKENLEKSGYFREEREGSQLWKQLYEKACAAFIDARRDDDVARPSFASRVDTAVAEARDIDTFPSISEDSDEWLDVNAEDFDAMLQQSFGKPAEEADKDASVSMDVDANAAKEERAAETQASRLKNLAKKVEEFVEGEGDLEGARFTDEILSDEELSDDEYPSESEHEETVPPEAAPEQLAARRDAMDKLVPGIDPTEYGKMPAQYYNNSQRTTRLTLATEVREKFTAGQSKEDEPATRRFVRPPILPRDEYEGVDSDDETDDEADEEDEEDQPQLVGDIEVDMEEEQEEFLEFARQALGMSDEQWNSLVSERKSRGAFVPAQAGTGKKGASKSLDIVSGVLVHEQTRAANELTKGARPNTNPKLDTFEAVMQAMDAEIAHTRSERQEPSESRFRDKGKARATESETGVEGDIEAAMDAELKAALDRGSDEEDAEGTMDEDRLDYNLIKNFLDSFKNQGGLSGPVSNLAGRLTPGWTLPRDQA